MSKELSKELRYLWLFLAFLGTLWFVNDIKAQNNNIEVIYPGKPAPLFSETNLAPEQKITKQITIRNNYSAPQDLGIQTLNINDSDFASVLMLEISNPPTLLSSSLLNLAQPKETFIASILPGDTQFDLSAYLDKTATNQYQDKNISFDIKFGFLVRETPPPEPTPPSVLGPVVKKLLSALPSTITPTEEGIEAPEEEKVLGEEAEKECCKEAKVLCLPWWAWLLLLLAIIGIFYLLYRRSKKE